MDDEALADAILFAIDKAVAPLIDRIRVLEAREPLRGEKGDPGECGAAGVDGKDGANGRDGVDGAPGAPGERGLDGAKGADGAPGLAGKDGADGVGLADALLDREGNLVVTFTDGRTKTLGDVMGKDGAPGERGADGRDGFGFDDFTVEQSDDFRTVTLRFTRGAIEKTFPLVFPVVLDAGVFREGAAYAKGDAVSFGGSGWIAQVDAPVEKPGTGSEWRLSTKKGRDGRDGVVKAIEPPKPVKV